MCVSVSGSVGPAGPARCPVSAGSRHPAPARGPTGAVRSSRGQVNRRMGTEAGELWQRVRPRTQASPRSRGPGWPPDVRRISPAGRARPLMPASAGRRSGEGSGQHQSRSRAPWGWRCPVQPLHCRAGASCSVAQSGWGHLRETGPLCPSCSRGSGHLGQFLGGRLLPAVCQLRRQKHQMQTLVLSPAVCVSCA